MNTTAKITTHRDAKGRFCKASAAGAVATTYDVTRDARGRFVAMLAEDFMAALVGWVPASAQSYRTRDEKYANRAARRAA